MVGLDTVLLLLPGVVVIHYWGGFLVHMKHGSLVVPVRDWEEARHSRSCTQTHTHTHTNTQLTIIFENINHFCGATDTSVLDFYLHLFWVLKPLWILVWFVACVQWTHRIHMSHFPVFWGWERDCFSLTDQWTTFLRDEQCAPVH